MEAEAIAEASRDLEGLGILAAQFWDMVVQAIPALLALGFLLILLAKFSPTTYEKIIAIFLSKKMQARRAEAHRAKAGHGETIIITNGAGTTLVNNVASIMTEVKHLTGVTESLKKCVNKLTDRITELELDAAYKKGQEKGKSAGKKRAKPRKRK